MDGGSFLRLGRGCTLNDCGAQDAPAMFSVPAADTRNNAAEKARLYLRK